MSINLAGVTNRSAERIALAREETVRDVPHIWTSSERKVTFGDFHVNFLGDSRIVELFNKIFES